MDLVSVLETALSQLRSGPRDLVKIIVFVAENNDAGSGDELMAELRAGLDQTLVDPNDPAVARLARSIRQWDHEEAPAWALETLSHSIPRRQVIYQKLGLSAEDAARLERAIPPYEPKALATIISGAHELWYDAGRSTRKTFYWDAYASQLYAPGSGWTPEAIGILANTTEDIVSRLSDPTRKETYPVKGLVVGYVQSGKTAHFTGVIAKAIDAGYRLIIVLAGTLNVLRRQTQRRIDKELVGREQLSEEEYQGDAGWAQFLTHNGLPSEQGFVDIERLTGLDEDYSPLRARISALKFKRAAPHLPFNHPSNLAAAPVRLVVIKKMPKMITDLTEDLNALKAQGTRLDEIPTLIIDDESDQASVNTVKQTSEDKRDRTATNEAIVSLINTLPRAQYVGYTATPFANVFIDPDDAEQLFPKDFIVSLPRPLGYMGVREFFDFDSEPDKPGPNQKRHVRFVTGEDSAEKNLPRAIDLFLLAGALKLFRRSIEPDLRFKHHTMLIHHAALTEVHEKVSDEVQGYFDQASLLSPVRLTHLRTLYESDVVPHLDGKWPAPESFEQLKQWLARCIAEINLGKAVRIVNGDEKNADDIPDFDGGPVWAILIGGTKLSRGYTVEGLTVSYYRRRAGAGDTLMQMGRWFGFRKGYEDLVRWFVGTEEPVGKSGRTADLYLQFRALCRDEELFRDELRKYAEDPDIRPIHIPPLVHSHLPSLKPTSRNKMYNAVLKFKNLGSRWIEKVAVSEEGRAFNRQIAAALLRTIPLRKLRLTAESPQEKISFDAFAGEASSDSVLSFLKNFRWSAGSRSFHFELEYLSGHHGDTRIRRWVVLLPQIAGDLLPWPEAGLDEVSIAERSYDAETGFSVFAEPRHRTIAGLLAKVKNELKASSPELSALTAPAGTAVLVMYLVRPRRTPAQWPEISVGFGVQLPESAISKQAVWTVSSKNDRDAVVVAATP